MPRRDMSPALTALKKVLKNPNSTAPERVAAIKGIAEITVMADKRLITEARAKAAEAKLKLDEKKGDFGI
jgi:hypothetical protein